MQGRWAAWVQTQLSREQQMRGEGLAKQMLLHSHHAGRQCKANQTQDFYNLSAWRNTKPTQCELRNHLCQAKGALRGHPAYRV